jgi:hypothetical protein
MSFRIPIIITLKDQKTGEIKEKESYYDSRFIGAYLRGLDEFNKANKGKTEQFLIYRVVSNKAILFEWGEAKYELKQINLPNN